MLSSRRSNVVLRGEKLHGSCRTVRAERLTLADGRPQRFILLTAGQLASAIGESLCVTSDRRLRSASGRFGSRQLRTWTFPRWTVRIVAFVGGSTQVVGSASPGFAGIVLI